ncbi:GyrI-like domain-containing protein [Nocardia spumae]|uniref:GyrI-like domain-containing protein n=1 Tax=Nocardia spumae TaxID=2887190 RepID=UPI001D14AB06|nr:GyrI-like domain-containing protein [Nocardia spumae]
MRYQVDVCEVPPQALLRLPRAVRADRPGEDVAAGMQELATAVTRAGLTASGPPTITYAETDRPGAATIVDFGVPVEPAPALSMQSGAEVVVRAGFLVARACHRGSYRGLGDAYRSLAEWTNHNGYRAAGPPTEVYLIGPDEVSDPRLLVTEIRLPVAPIPVLVAEAGKDFATALRRAREALRHNGFTILSEIDPLAALPDGRAPHPARHTVLEICRPSALVQAYDTDDCAGVMIPHPVVVRERPAGIVVAAADPTVWAQALADQELSPIAAEVRHHLVAAVAELAAATTTSDA